MPRPRVVTLVSSVVAAATVLAVAAPAGAAPTPTKSPLFLATSTGLALNLVGGLASAGPFAPVAMTTRSTAKSANASVTTAAVPQVLSSGAVNTDVSTRRNTADTATIVTGHAKTGKINLLGGVVTAGVVDTKAVLTVGKSKVTGTATSTYTNLRIAGQPVINGTVAPNTTIEVPGVARILLNASGVAGGQREGMAVSTAIIVTVLGGTTAGSTIAVNSTTAQTQYVSPFYAPLNGVAISAQVTVAADATLNVGPLGAIGMPPTGTNGQPITATLPSSNLAGLGSLGTGVSTAVGTVADSGSRSTMTNRITGLNLFGGLVTADALTTTADVSLNGDGTYTRTATVDFTNLSIAGGIVPLDVAPNTTIPLPGLGAAVLRGTATTDNAAAGAGLTITLTTAGYGLPAGATVTIGFAYASVAPNDL